MTASRPPLVVPEAAALVLSSDELHLYWLTDLHLVDAVTDQPDAEGAIRGNRHYYAAKQKLRKAVDTIQKEQPDVVICTGDITDHKQSLASFLEDWERITVPKEVVIGNHDLDNGYVSLVEQLGYAERAVIARSVFNRSVALQKGKVRVRLLLLDTNIGVDGQHLVETSEGALQDDAIAWLEHEMSTCPESLVFLFSHHGMAGPAHYFNRQDVARYNAMIQRIALARPDFQLVHCAGHHHVHPHAEIRELTRYETFVNGVAMISEAQSAIHVVSIASDHTWTLSYRKV
ncbi:metallophosphoesterase family protein [Paenibacillus oceani]|uniref:Metallophosphoesterase n=1 Tax=Paenibacillus oceani TaxID=2772510 RepID=A0A927GXL0_9BACL|nr:metallophosphoesterase [Paenibacillus oceani]MBD2860630.1 metallophosphoesterase [Paenibacillus oceani]